MSRRLSLAVAVAVTVVALAGAVLGPWGLQRGVGEPASPGASPASETHSSAAPTSATPASATPASTIPTSATPAFKASPSPGATASARVPVRLPEAAEPPIATATPARSGHVLSLPSIDLKQPLHAEGLRQGRVNPAAGTVMWFTGHDRVAPGEIGTSVIAGHVANRGKPDAFAHLADVVVGDRVELSGEGGPQVFVVVRAEVVDKDDLTRDQAVWGHNTSVRRLAIITCDDALGFRSDGHRAANYVVIAEPADQT